MNTRQKLIALNHKNLELTMKEISKTLTREDVLEALEFAVYPEDHDIDEYGRDLYEEMKVLNRFAKKYEL